jgi:catechol 2,3-dioxygenase-like lactoylglutathione lyase family enzyme
MELDHIALNVRDVERLLGFYSKVFGLETERVEEWREGKVPFPSLRLNAHTIIDFFPTNGDDGSKLVTSNRLNHFCLAVSSSVFQSVQEQAQSLGAEAVGEPRKLWGARGLALSRYYRDPEGNTFEVRCYEYPVA